MKGFLHAMRNVAMAAGVFVLLLQEVIASGVIVQEVQVGKTVELLCPSNDDKHRFQFWQLQGDVVLSPNNYYDRSKYKYDVLSGKLHIKSISSTEAGFYTCVSKSLNNAAFNSKSVELVVKKDWEDSYETDVETNLFRGLIAMGILLALLVIGVLLYMFRRHRIARFRDMSDEESPDDAPTGGSYNVTNISTTPTNIASNHGIDNPTLETDFPRVFKTIQTTSDSQI